MDNSTMRDQDLNRSERSSLMLEVIEEADNASGHLSFMDEFSNNSHDDFMAMSVRTSTASHRGAPQDSLVAERRKVQDMAASETKKVRLWRRNVLIIMFLTGAFITAIAYIFLNNNDNEDFEASVSVITLGIASVKT